MGILKIENLSKQYRKHQALQEVYMQMQPGKIFGLLGPNGAGKTTLIRCINRIVLPDSGQIYWQNHPLQQKDVRSFGYLPEERGLYPKMKLAEQLLYLAQLRDMPKAEAQAEIQKWLAHFDLLGQAQLKVNRLSKGMAQKAQFIATVLHRPQLLILDEPFSGFDPVNTELIKSEILKLRNAGATIMLSTHRMESVEELCDDIALIHQAKVVLQGAVKDIVNQHRQGVYKLEIETKSREAEPVQPFTPPPQAEVLEHQKQGAQHYFRLRGLPGEAILQWAQSVGAVRHFSEEKPTLQQIFIKTVQENV